MCDKEPTNQDSKRAFEEAERQGMLGYAVPKFYNPSLDSLMRQREGLLEQLVKVQEAIKLLKQL